MITNFLRKILHLDENDEEIIKIQNKADEEIKQTVARMKRAGKLQEVVIKKTSNYFIFKAMGGIS